EDGIRDRTVTGVQTCALPIYSRIRTLRPDGVMNRAPAAREKFRCCATRRKARSCREVKSIINQDSSIIELFELVSQSALELNSHNVTGAPRWETFSAM